MITDIPEHATTEEKLLMLIETLQEIKQDIADLAFDEENDDLNDALEYLDDAIDSIGEAVDKLDKE